LLVFTLAVHERRGRRKIIPRPGGREGEEEERKGYLSGLSLSPFTIH